MFKIKYRVKPMNNGVWDECYAVQKKIIFWWTIRYFRTYRGADLWIDKNILDI
jgi:hypothetical protein